MTYSEHQAEITASIFESERPEDAEVNQWEHNLLPLLTTTDLENYRDYLETKLDEDMDDSMNSNFAIGTPEHSLELIKLSDTGQHLLVAETALTLKE